MAALARVAVGLVLLFTIGACGDDGGSDSSPGASTTAPITSSSNTSSPATSPQTTPGSPPTTLTADSRRCTTIAIEALKLAGDYANEVRGIAGANEEKYKAAARALRDKAQQAGCPVPTALDDFLR